jgi:hypothetical protein
MRLQNVVKNQLLAVSEPPDEFTSLDGQLVEIGKSSKGSSLELANYDGGWGQVKLVVVEYRACDNAIKIAPNGIFEESMAPIRNCLVALQLLSLGCARRGPRYLRFSICTLPCLGYFGIPR